MNIRSIQESFCLLKSEAYILGKRDFIHKKIRQSGLKIEETWKVRLNFSDIFRLYEGWAARIFSLMRMPPLFELDMYILNGPDAIARMYRLKHRIRHEIWGFRYDKGGFLHAPDSIEEARRHKSILAGRTVSRLAPAVDGRNVRPPAKSPLSDIGSRH